MKSISIIGGGFSAWLIATIFIKKNFSVNIFEGENKHFGSQQISHNGWKVLTQIVDIKDLKPVLEAFNAIHIKKINSEEILELLSNYDLTNNNEVYGSISRENLVNILKQKVLSNKNIQILITAGDVLHSWAVPSMGLKTDAVPGRLNETWVNVKEPGIYRGQCSEICGTGHGFMPVVVKVLPESEFIAWANEAKNNYAINEDIKTNETNEEIIISQNNLIQLEENNL